MHQLVSNKAEYKKWHVIIQVHTMKGGRQRRERYTSEKKIYSTTKLCPTTTIIIIEPWKQVNKGEKGIQGKKKLFNQ